MSFIPGLFRINRDFEPKTSAARFFAHSARRLNTSAGRPFNLEVESHTSDFRKVFYSIATYDEKGEVVSPQDFPETPANLSEHKLTSIEGLRTPSGIPDGFYRTIAKVSAFSSASEFSTQSIISYKIESGEIEIFSPETWERVSGHDLAIRIDGAGGAYRGRQGGNGGE